MVSLRVTRRLKFAKEYALSSGCGDERFRSTHNPHADGIRVTLADEAIQQFASQMREFAEGGARGIERVMTRLHGSREHVVESLLFRDNSGKLRGILHHHPRAFAPFAFEHEIQIRVDPVGRDFAEVRSPFDNSARLGRAGVRRSLSDLKLYRW